MIKLIGLHCKISTVPDEDGMLIVCHQDDLNGCPKQQTGVFNKQCIACEV